MTRTTIFMSHRSQAVRLAKDAAFPAGVKEVAVFIEAPGIDLGPRDQPDVLTELLHGAAKSARSWNDRAK